MNEFNSKVVNNLLDDEVISNINLLSNYYFEFGLFENNSNIMDDATILNTDNTTSTIKLSLGEILYFIEHGTITMPAQSILEKILIYANTKIDIVYNDLLERILVDNISRDTIIGVLHNVALDITNYSKLVCKNHKDFNNIVNNILKSNETIQIYDLNKLSNYIECRLQHKA